MSGLRAWPAWLILLLVCRGMLAQASDGAVVEGRIVNKDISGAIVRLQKEPVDPLAYIDGYSAVVEADGSFRFHDIAPGAYRLTGEAKEWNYGEYGSNSPGQPGKILRVEAGAYLRSLELVLFPAPETICGYVVDSTGKPLQVNVEEYSVTQQDGVQRLYPKLPTRHTDSNGYFSFPKVERGRGYFIRAGGVWYPSTRDFAQAVQLIPASLSASGCQANIRIANESCTGRVTAKSASTLQCPVSEYEVSLYGVNPSGALFLADKTPSGLAEGAEFEGVCSGSYVVVAKQKGYCKGQEHWQQLASPVFQLSGPTATVALNEAEDRNVNRDGEPADPVPPRSSLTGALRFEGLTENEACPTHSYQRVQLISKEYAAVSNTRIGPQGSFAFDKLQPESYQLSFLATMHGAMYLKSFQVNGRDADPMRINLLPGQAVHVDAVFGSDPEGAAGHPHADSAAPLHFLPDGMHPAASVSGRVTGGAAKDLSVMLSSIRYNSATSAEYWTTAAEDGSFHFDKVDPGLYRLYAVGGAYQHSTFKAKAPGLEGVPVVLTAGQHLDNLSIKLFRKVSLCGRVLDAGGSPRSGIQVKAQAYVHPARGNSNATLFWNGTAVTDSQGRYRIEDIVLMKDLWLWAESNGKKTYYPSASDPSQTQPIQLGGRNSACTYDIRLHSPIKEMTEKGYGVTGTIVGQIDPALGHRFRVVIGDPARQNSWLPAPGEIEADGRFELHGVWPGRYTLNLITECDDARISCDPKYDAQYAHTALPEDFFHRILASRQITVTNADISGLKIALTPLSKLKGQILIDGRAKSGNLSNFSPVLLERTARFEVPSREAMTEVQIEGQGHFSFKNLAARDYAFHLYDLWKNNYVKLMLLNGKPVHGTRIRLGAGQTAHLSVHLASDGASGTVTPGPTQIPIDEYEDDCRNWGGRPLMVMMIPDVLPADNSGILVGGIQMNGQNVWDGVFHYNGVPPGRYHLLALDLLDHIQGRLMGADDAVFENHDALVKLGALGKAVEVHSRQHFEWVAPVVTEQMMRLKAQLGLPESQ